MRSVFGWSLPPGCGTLPGEESQPPSCEECQDDEYEQCQGQDKCQKVYLDGSPACCLEHKIEMTCGECGECQADFWAMCDLDLTTAKDRVRLLKAKFTKYYPKRIEKLYLEALRLKVKYIKTVEDFSDNPKDRSYCFEGEADEIFISVI